MRLVRGNKERYRIQGKTYYKEEDLPVTDDMRGIVTEMWKMSNPKGAEFKMLIRRGKPNSFILYDSEDRRILKTYSISKIGD